MPVRKKPSLFCFLLLGKTRIRSLLYPLCVAAGCCYGSMFSLVLALTADIFGPEHVGTNYGLLDLGETTGHSFIHPFRSFL